MKKILILSILITLLFGVNVYGDSIEGTCQEGEITPDPESGDTFPVGVPFSGASYVSGYYATKPEWAGSTCQFLDPVPHSWNFCYLGNSRWIGYSTTGDNFVDCVDPIEDCNEDGIPDEYELGDPCATPEDFEWKVVSWCNDSEGVMAYALIEKDGEYYQMGDKENCYGYDFLNFGGGYKNKEDYQNFLGGDGGGMTGGSSGSGGGMTQPGAYQSPVGTDKTTPDVSADAGLQGGTDGGSHSVAEDLLKDIVQNTQENLQNQAIDNQYQASIYKKLGDLIEQDQKIGQALDGAKIGQEVGKAVAEKMDELPGSIGESIEGKLQDLKADDQAEEASESDTQNTALDGISTELDSTVTGDIPEENTIASVVSSFVDSNPVGAYLTGSSVQVSNALCEMTVPIYGHDIKLTMCAFQEQLQAWGTILVAFSSIVGLMIVFKR